MTDEKETTTMLWACVKCMAKRAAQLLHCPHCGEAEYQEAPGGEVAPGAPVLNAAATAVVEPVATKPKPAKKAADTPTEPAQAAADAPAAS